MRLHRLRAFALIVGFVLLDAVVDAPRPASAGLSVTCGDPGQCLTNSAMNNRAMPTTVATDDKGDATFFASQSGQLPNVLFVLDNSTSMYELPYDVHTFPNTYWVNAGTNTTGTPAGATPNGCGNITTATTGSLASCNQTSWAQTAASCGGNTFFSGLKDSSGNPYNKATTYAVPDAFYDGTHSTAAFFTSNKIYKHFEWALNGNINNATPTPGGVANAGPITWASGTPKATGTANNSCLQFSSTTGSGGSGGTGSNQWSMTQQQRCQQCLDEVGYYIAPGSSATEGSGGGGANASSNIIFKGNWLNFYPPKWLIARKVLTDFISRQSSTPTPVRVGVVTYDPGNTSSMDYPSSPTGLRSTDGGHFVSSGMMPDCAPPGNTTDWTSTTVQTQQSNLITAVRNISWGTSNSSPIATPIAETMFNVGQFFGGSNSFYTSKFGSSWLKSEFTAPGPTAGNRPICVACQVSAIVLITDGAPEGDNNLPQMFRDDKIECSPGGNAAPPTGCGKDLWTSSNTSNNLLDDVTNFLSNTDLDGDSTNGIQDVITFVIGIGLKVPLLDNAAKFGKTTQAMRADNVQDLQDEVTSAVINIVARATAFSSTAIQTLEVGTGSTAFVPRFVPGSPTDPIWEGHLYRFNLFNEFVAGVDKNGDSKLDGVFLVDKDGDIVSEDDKGAFHKVINGSLAAPAVPIWDAGAVLQAKAPSARTIYTAVWDSTNTKWRTLTLPTWDGTGSPPADFTAIENQMALTGTNACARIKASMYALSSPSPYLNSAGVFDNDHCAKAILDYVRGYNILNELTTTTSVTATRAHMLGDIFHSSPVVVDPPVDQFICNLGLHSQCVSSLYQYDMYQPIPRLVNPTPSAQYTVGGKTITAYEKYWQDHETRQRIVLVGANDGLIHAFDAGTPTATPPAMNPNVGFRQVVYGDGTGDELWSFIPPDQLPRLWLMMRDGHQIYMDGDIMVRDVWVDGQQNDKGGAGFVNTPFTKQDVEYHTIAVVSERQGGTHFTALDVTDTTVPNMLWVYPPPCSDDESLWGQTWGQFSPRPPPIGPVLLETSDTRGLNNLGTKTEERYVVLLNGGHSSFNNRGRLVSMLDVWTGAPLYVSRYNPASTLTNDPAAAMRFAFPATGALVDWGKGTGYDNDGMFDTGVIGDEGGQIWTLRMAMPGKVDSTTGLVSNWVMGRAYEPNTSAPNDTRYHNPIYTMAATYGQVNPSQMRAFLGSGDRAHVRSQNGGDCRPDDPMSCINAGCTVTNTLTMDNGTRHLDSTFGTGATNSASSPTMASPAVATTAMLTNACNLSSVTESVTVGGTSCPAGMGFTQSLSWQCNTATSPSGCTEGTFPAPHNANRNYSATPPVGVNTFVGVVVLGDVPSRGMVDGTPNGSGVKDFVAYDQGRYTFSSLTDVTNTTADASGNVTSTSAPAASPSGPGWGIKFGNIDEKTVTSASILGGCVLWETMLPSGGTTNLGCASAGANTAYSWQGDPFTGAPNCAAQFLSGANYTRTLSRQVLSPPPEPAAAVAVGSGGGLRLGKLDIQPGKQEVTQTQVSTSNDTFKILYSLPLTVDQHICRHVDPTKCK